MPKPGFTGVKPGRFVGHEAIECEPHLARYWQPFVDGKPLLVNGHVLRYDRLADAKASLDAAVKRRQPLKRNYKLGQRMAPSGDSK